MEKDKMNESESVKAELNPSLVDPQNWDEYWSGKETKKSDRKLYDLIAQFYRKFLIRPTLNHFIRKYFKPGSQVLHAGCGSGQVDADIREYVNITGMDISVNALRVFEYESQGKAKSLHGSIFEIPLPNCSMDGIYNLGVMEHFTHDEIDKILGQFKRVLRDNGKMILLWPPEFGLSVIFFKVLKFIIVALTGKKDVKFHPDEVSRIQSKKEARAILARNGLEMVEYSFSVRDIFTYSVLVAQKKY